VPSKLVDGLVKTNPEIFLLLEKEIDLVFI